MKENEDKRQISLSWAQKLHSKCKKDSPISNGLSLQWKCHPNNACFYPGRRNTGNTSYNNNEY